MFFLKNLVLFKPLMLRIGFSAGIRFGNQVRKLLRQGGHQTLCKELCFLKIGWIIINEQSIDRTQLHIGYQCSNTASLRFPINRREDKQIPHAYFFECSFCFINVILAAYRIDYSNIRQTSDKAKIRLDRLNFPLRENPFPESLVQIPYYKFDFVEIVHTVFALLLIMIIFEVT